MKDSNGLETHNNEKLIVLSGKTIFHKPTYFEIMQIISKLTIHYCFTLRDA